MKKSSTFLTLVLCFALNLSSKAQLIQTIFQFNFNSIPTLLSGVDKAVGARYLFANVSLGKDAIVKIKSATGGATVDILDDNNITKPEAFSPKISVPGNQTGLVEFEIQLVLAGTLNSIMQDTLYATAIDIDGNATLKEMDVIDLGGGTSSYQSGTPEITVTQNGTAFTGKNVAGNEYADIDTSAKAVMFTVKKNNVSTFIYKAGAVNSTNNASSRQKAIYFKNFTYPPAIILLPVKLTAFSVSNVNGKASVNWSTAMEMNAKSYIVERSADGTNFTSVAEVKAKGNSSIETKYNLSDYSPLAGKSFYRLQQIDLDGKITYSQAILFSAEKTVNKISVFPNPAKGFTVASITAAKDESIQLQLIDATGRAVISRSEKISKGFNSIMLNNLDKLVPGQYNLRVIQSGETSTHPLLIL